METKYNELQDFFDIFSEKHNDEIKNGNKSFQVIYLTENLSFEIKFITKVGSGRLIYSIQFPVDFGSIQFFLDSKQENSNKPKINISSIEDRNLLAENLSDKFGNFTKFIEYVGFFNSHKDYCAEIADFIINSKGAIIGRKFGL
jgi:hypothetical protein